MDLGPWRFSDESRHIKMKMHFDGRPMAGVELILSSHIKDMNNLVLLFTEAFKERCISTP